MWGQAQLRRHLYMWSKGIKLISPPYARTHTMYTLHIMGHLLISASGHGMANSARNTSCTCRVQRTCTKELASMRREINIELINRFTGLENWGERGKGTNTLWHACMLLIGSQCVCVCVCVCLCALNCYRFLLVEPLTQTPSKLSRRWWAGISMRESNSALRQALCSRSLAVEVEGEKEREREREKWRRD